MNKIVGIVLGLILLLVPIYDWMTDISGLGIGNAALMILKGGLVWILIVAGIMLLIISLSGLKE